MVRSLAGKFVLIRGYSEKVQVGKDQEKAQSEKDSHSKSRGQEKAQSEKDSHSKNRGNL